MCAFDTVQWNQSCSPAPEIRESRAEKVLEDESVKICVFLGVLIRQTRFGVWNHVLDTGRHW